MRKTAKYFIGLVSGWEEAQLPPEGEILDRRWAKYQEAKQLLYQNVVQEVLTPADQFLSDSFDDSLNL